MSDPMLSGIDFKNKMAWFETILKISSFWIKNSTSSLYFFQCKKAWISISYFIYLLGWSKSLTNSISTII